MESWISVDKTSGSGNASVKVTTSVNEGADRQTTVTVQTKGGKTASVICSQTGGKHAERCVGSRKTECSNYKWQ